MENLLYAIDLDTNMGRKAANAAANAKEEEKKADKKGKKGEDKNNQKSSARGDASDRPVVPLAQQQKIQGVVNLRFEECKIQKKAASILSEWLKNKAQIETLGLIKVTFEDVHDFKKITEGMKLNQKLLKVSF